MNADTYNIRCKYNVNYNYATTQKRHKKHLRGSDLLDKSSEYRLSVIRASKDANTQYVTYKGQKTRVKDLLASIRHARREGKKINATISSDGKHIIVYENGMYINYNIYNSNKLQRYKLDTKMYHKLYN